MLLAAGLALAAPAVSPGRALDFAPCGEPEGILCARVTVPLDRSGVVPGSIDIFLHKKPATSGTSQGALFYLEGGPGEPGTEGTVSLAQTFAAELETRDFYVIDYPGVGLSQALSCPSAASDWHKCGDELGPAAHLYSTREIIDDLEDVRRSLGLDRISIVGVSYGTKFAQAYALKYGDRVDRLYLDSVIPVDGWDGLMVSSFASLKRLLREICSAGRCAGITRDPLADIAAFATAAIRKPPTVSYVRTNGTVARRTFDPRHDFNRLFFSDIAMFQASVRARWPSAVRSALQGDTLPLGRLLFAAEQFQGEHSPDEFNRVAFRATKCEDLRSPWRGVSPDSEKVRRLFDAVAALAPQTVYPLPLETVRYAGNSYDCLAWPEAPAAPVLERNVQFTGPTLIVDGTQDTRTPLEDARAAAALFPGSVLVAVPDSGHGAGVDSRSPTCAARAVDDFFKGQPVTSCPASVTPLFPPAPVAPVALDRVKPWAGVAGLRGQTLRASIEAALDARYTAYSGAPRVGLRGGTFTISTEKSTRNGLPVSVLTTVKLNRIVYVSGVVVSGTVDARDGTGTITIAGTGARGVLKITKTQITGSLDGAPVVAAYTPLLLGVQNRR